MHFLFFELEKLDGRLFIWLVPHATLVESAILRVQLALFVQMGLLEREVQKLIFFRTISQCHESVGSLPIEVVPPSRHKSFSNVLLPLGPEKSCSVHGSEVLEYLEKTLTTRPGDSCSWRVPLQAAASLSRHYSTTRWPSLVTLKGS